MWVFIVEFYGFYLLFCTMAITTHITQHSVLHYGGMAWTECLSGSACGVCDAMIININLYNFSMQIFMLHNMLVRIFFTFCLFLFRIEFFPIKWNRFENHRVVKNRNTFSHIQMLIYYCSSIHMFHAADHLYLSRKNKQENITQYYEFKLVEEIILVTS